MAGASAGEIRSPVGVIAGGGVLPFAVADALRSRGIDSVLFAIKGFCDASRADTVRHHWISLGQFGRLTALLRSERCRDVMFVGSVVRPALSEIRLDWGTLRVFRALMASFRGGDDHLLGGVGRLFERNGFRLLGIGDAVPELLASAGALTTRTPDARDRDDIAKGRAVLDALAAFDVGQACVVIEGHVVAVEDIGGTDALLAGIARLRAAGMIRAPSGRGVLVKAPKRNQDRRFDLPAVGPSTVAAAAAAGLAGIAVAAGGAVMAEPQAMIEAAERAGLFVFGMPS